MHTIFAAIEKYATAYSLLEAIQREHPNELPRGDQKTGVIAEFFARLYAKNRFPESKLEFGTTSEHAWDIRIVRPKKAPLLIQVKAVSAHAEKSRVSPLHPGWDELWLMRLNECLLPEGFWTIKKSEVNWSNKIYKSSTMPRRDKPNVGSLIYRGAKDELPQLLLALKTANKSIQGIASKLAPPDFKRHALP